MNGTLSYWLEKLSSLTSSIRSQKSKNLAPLLSKVFSFPELSYPTIHVAGSNGKGSVSTKVAKALELAGYKVGLYTSPHLVSFCERIQINSSWISEQEVVEGLRYIFSLCKDRNLYPSTFEVTTFLAFLYFQKQKVDIAVIETGLGGRLDATNVIEPCLSIITSISLEHMDILGSCIEQIAKEKAGIIKPSIPVVLGPKAAIPSILDDAASKNAPVFLSSCDEVYFENENQQIAKVALTVLKQRFFLLLDVHIKEGITYRPSCRFELHDPFLFDVAHNPDAFDRLFKAIELHYPSYALQSVIGLAHDKDLQGCLRIASTYCRHVHLVKAHSPRPATLEKMSGCLHDLFYSSYTLHKSVPIAMRHAKKQMSSLKELIVVCGSFYIMKEAKLGLASLKCKSDR